MAFVIADRVRETSTSTGTGNFTLGGAVIGYQTFGSVLTTGDTTYYTIADQGGTNWEVGIGTFTSPSTLARTTILSSSNGGSVVTFTAGTKDVFISLPASKTNTNDQPNVIAVNSTSNALRITQTGTGNALVVEDSTNPDATPFVVDASGRVLIGADSAASSSLNLSIFNVAVATTPAVADFYKNRGGAVVSSGDGVGRIRFYGYDGASYLEAARIDSLVDGTPGTNDMPGNLRFLTTADGASSVTERMRIDASGNVGIGTSNPTARLNVVDNTSQDALRITQTGTGNALVVEDSANPDVTPFVVDASGKVIIGASAPTTLASGVPAFQSNAPGVTPIDGISWFNGANAHFGFGKSRGGTVGVNGIVASGDTTNLDFRFDDGTGFVRAALIAAAVDGTPGTNDMPGRLVFSTTADGASSPTERMRIDNLGRVGINSTALTGYQVRIAGTYASTDVSPIWMAINGTIPSTATGQAYGFFSGSATQAAAFTLTGLNHFFASQGGVGAGSALTNQYGFRANSNLTGATNNYGFFSDIASGTGRWNFYANGTADNYFAGQVQLGAGTAAAPALSAFGDTNTGMFFPAADTIAFAEGGAEVMRIDSSGNVGIGTSSPGSKLDVKGTLRLSGATSGYVGLAPAAAAGSTTYTLPAADGTSGQVLSTNGSGTLSWASAAGGTGTLKNVQVFTSSGTYTRTSGVTTAVVIAVGGGGGGRGVSSASATSGTNGSAGGTTSFGSHVSAVGGSGGTGSRAPGAGGTGGTGATIAIKGDPGSTGTGIENNTTATCGGSGGGQGGGVGGAVAAGAVGVSGAAGVRGGGGGGGAYHDTGTIVNFGGGGGQGETCIKYTTTVGATETVTIGAGGAGGSSTASGGAGGAGYIIVYEYS